MPATAGQYEFRFFSNNSFTLLAKTGTISVASSKFVAGERVKTTASSNVRSSASATAALVGTQATGALGTVVGGPTVGGSYTWFNVNFDSGADGWVIQGNLTGTLATASPFGSSLALATNADIAPQDASAIAYREHQIADLTGQVAMLKQQLQAAVGGAGR